MDPPSEHYPVLLVLPAFSRYEAALDWVRETAQRQWGPLALESERFPFTETQYYQKTMGDDLHLGFFAFQRLIDPAQLAKIKLLTIRWEDEYRRLNDWPEPRPLNLDPGYLTNAKLVLATTKDRDHRIYLSHGIYAEVTLFYQSGRWRHRDWTYPNYRREDYHRFFDRCREYLRGEKVNTKD